MITMKRPLIASFFAIAAASHGISFGQLDTFTSGAANWSGSSPTLALGGPGGASDQYLRLQSGPGFSPKMAARNQVQWLGNYTAAGVNQVTLNVANFGANQIELRVVLFGSAGQEFTSASSTPIVADGLWRSISFSLLQSALTSVGTGSDYAGMMTAVTNFQFRNNPGAAAGSGSQTNFTGIMGIDNVNAVPEPGSLLALGFGWAALRRRASRK